MVLKVCEIVHQFGVKWSFYEPWEPWVCIWRTLGSRGFHVQWVNFAWQFQALCAFLDKKMIILHMECKKEHVVETNLIVMTFSKWELFASSCLLIGMVPWNQNDFTPTHLWFFFSIKLHKLSWVTMVRGRSPLSTFSFLQCWLLLFFLFLYHFALRQYLL